MVSDKELDAVPKPGNPITTSLTGLWRRPGAKCVFLIVFAINIYTWKKGQPDPLTFNKMVKNDLDEFFEKINSWYENNTE